MTLTLGGLLGQDVAKIRLGALDPAAPLDRKALGGAFLGLHLGHDSSLLSMRRRVAPNGNGTLSDRGTACFTEPGARRTALPYCLLLCWLFRSRRCLLLDATLLGR